MFGSFYASLPVTQQSQPSSSAASPTPSAADTVRPKRKQVARACDWCRIHRIKCDTEQPCRNCRSRGGECSNNGSLSQVRTLPRAIREIESLRQRILELEESLESMRLETDSQKSVSRSPGGGPTSQAPAFSSSPSSISQRSRKLSEGRQDDAASDLNQSIGKLSRENSSLSAFSLAPVSPGRQFHGPSSAVSFLERVNSYLRSILEEPTAHHTPTGPNILGSGSVYVSPIESDDGALATPLPLLQQSWQGKGNTPFSGVELTRAQESYFIGLFCNSWHCCYNVLDDAGFKNHWKSLWITESGSISASRKSSALVDIVVGLGMQYASVVEPPDLAARTRLDVQEVSVLSRWLYQRCQSLIIDEIEKPLLKTAQAQFLSVLYLDNKSRPTTAHAMLAASLRTSEALGLHLEPSPEFTAAERELRKRLWWSLVSYDINLCIRLGRPWGASLGDAGCTCSLPFDNLDGSVPALPSDLEDGVTALSYALQDTKLALAGRLVSDAVSSNCAEPPAKSLQAVQAWLDAVPDGLKTSRRGGGLPFSTDVTEMEIDGFSPPWLQCQRLLLEVHYHNLVMTLCRSCIVFPVPPSDLSSTPLATSDLTPHALQHAELATRHAVAVTHLLQQVLIESDLLNGWREPYNVQWNAAITLAGFVIAYPRAGEVTQAARRALASSVSVLEMMGHFLVDVGRQTAVAINLAAQAERFANNGSAGVSEVADHAAMVVPGDFEFDFSREAQDFVGFNDTTTPASGMYEPWTYGMDIRRDRDQ